MRRARDAITPAAVLLGLILVAGLALRLRNNGYGLPYVWNVDEGSHFTSRAVAMFGGDPNPGYFQNPSGFTYLVYAALKLRDLLPFGSFDDVIGLFKRNPTEIYETGRTLAALICLAGVAALYWAAKRLWGVRVALVAAALLCFSFLAVVYSRIAATDVGTLAPVALSVWASVRALEDGRRAHFVAAGALAGLAVGFKYTAGLVLLPLAIAVVARFWRERGERRELVLTAALAGAAAIAVFALTTPYFVLDFDTAERQIRAQAETAGEFSKLGQEDDTGILYYLDFLTWGLGWLALAAAIAGAVIELRRDRLRGLLLIAFPLALLLYLSLQSRYFGRWLLPAYPVLAMLAGVAIVRAADAIAARLRGPERIAPATRAAAVAAVLTIVVLVQPVLADLRTARLLGRADTRELAREWLVDHFPPRLRIVIEPAVPARYYRLATPGRNAPLNRKQFVRGFARDVQETRVDYAATLEPERIDRYREAGFCVVMTMSVIRGRAENAGEEESLAYYRRLERESDLIYEQSPYKDGADAPNFHFDLSYNYYPSAFERPGPEVRIYKLHDCRQGYGPVERGAGTPERRRATSAESAE